jgi:hypothetical protein
MAGAMNDAVNFNGSPLNDIEHKVGFNDKHPVTRDSESFISRDPPEEGGRLKTADTLIEFFDKSCGVRWTVPGNPVKA